MPQLFSRMDSINWLTPAIADILDQGAAPPGGDGSIREQMLSLQKKLGNLDTPARVINVRPTPSYTLFIAKPDTVGRLGSRRIVTSNEIKRSLAQIADENREWKLGFMPELQDTPDALGILLRTAEHTPTSLRRLLVRSSFRDHQSNLAFVIGNTLEQKLAIQDLASIGNLLVLGAEGSKHHFINSLLLTLTMLNTPGELRLAIIGQSAEFLKLLVKTPHALGRWLPDVSAGQRLLSGLTQELERRKEGFEREGVTSIAEYNAKLKDDDRPNLPRILLVLDSISDEGWGAAGDQWVPATTKLLKNNGQVGIHLIIAANQLEDIPQSIEEKLPYRVVMRNVAQSYIDKLENFHGSLMRFIDAFLVEKNGDVTPVELCAISQSEIQRVVSYWHQAVKQRDLANEKIDVSGKTGVTGMLPQPEQLETSELRNAMQDEPLRSFNETDETPRVTPDVSVILPQATALAAYLGWIGIGPLTDILGLSADEANEVIQTLKSNKIVENVDYKTPRFISPNAE